MGGWKNSLGAAESDEGPLRIGYSSLLNVSASLDSPSLDYSLYSHVVFTHIDISSTEDMVINPSEPVRASMVKFVQDAKTAGAKPVIAVGKWMGLENNVFRESSPLSVISSDATGRKKLIDSCLAFLEDFGFEGIEIHWYLPGIAMCGGGKDDSINLVSLMQELKTALIPRHVSLSLAVSGIPSALIQSYHFPNLINHVDWFSVMAFDYYVPWGDLTIGPHTALVNEHIPSLSLSAVVDCLELNGVPLNKIVVAFSCVAHSWKLRYPQNLVSGSRAIAPGSPGKFHKREGFLSLPDFTAYISENTDCEFGFDRVSRTKYAFSPSRREWISFDDLETVKLKLEYCHARKVRGIALHSIDYDERNKEKSFSYLISQYLTSPTWKSNVDVEEIIQLPVPGTGDSNSSRMAEEGLLRDCDELGINHCGFFNTIRIILIVFCGMILLCMLAILILAMTQRGALGLKNLLTSTTVSDHPSNGQGYEKVNRMDEDCDIPKAKIPRRSLKDETSNEFSTPPNFHFNIQAVSLPEMYSRRHDSSIGGNSMRPFQGLVPPPSSGSFKVRYSSTQPSRAQNLESAD